MRAIGYIGVCLLGIGALAGGCAGPSGQVDTGVISVGQAIASPEELKASDYFKEIRYVPLETTDDCLIGEAPDVKLTEDYILITTRRQCLLFDKATGKFVRSIGHRGNDPGGYSDANARVDEPNGRLLFAGWNHDWLVYGLDGNYQGKIESPALSEEAYPADCFAVNKDTLIGYFPNTQGTEKNRILYFSEAGERLGVLPNRESCPSFKINSMSVWQGEEAMEVFGPALRSAIYMEGRDRETASLYFPNSAPFWRTGDDIYFMELYNDTIYRSEGIGLVPCLRFDRGDLTWRYADRFRKEAGEGILIPHVLDSERLLFGIAITDIYDEDSRQTYAIAFDKRSGMTRAGLYEEGIKDDLTGFLPIRLMAVSSSGEFAGLHAAVDIRKWFDEHGDAAKADALTNLAGLGEEDNPVVVLLR